MDESRRKVIGVIVLVLILVVSTITATWIFQEPNVDNSLREAVIEDGNGDRLTISVAAGLVWDLLDDLHENGTWMWIGGLVGDHDGPWGFSFESDSISILQDTPEESRSSILEISEDRSYWMDYGPVFVFAKVVVYDGIPVFIGAANNYTIDAVLHTNNHSLNGRLSVDYVNRASVILDEIVFHIYPNAFQTDGYG